MTDAVWLSRETSNDLTPEKGMSIVVDTRGRVYGPSSFLRTRSTAPEQPPQVMVMLKLYVWSDMMCS